MKMKLTTRGPKTAQAIADRQEFATSGALRAAYWRTGHHSFGQLPQEWLSKFRDAITLDMYVVYSYRTPIAWWTESNGWVIPPVKYSMTTSHHQGVLYLAHAQKRVDDNN